MVNIEGSITEIKTLHSEDGSPYYQIKIQTYDYTENGNIRALHLGKGRVSQD